MTKTYKPSKDKSFALWRETEDKVILKLPYLKEVPISNEAAQKLFSDVCKVVGVKVINCNKLSREK